MDALTRLQQKVARHSVVPGRSGADGPQSIVIVPPRADLASTFALARELIDVGKHVRIIAGGITLHADLPQWMSSAEGFTLSELGGYQPRARMASSRVIANALDTWGRRMFEGGWGPAIDWASLRSVAASRLVQPFMDFTAVAEGIRMLHPHDDIHCTDETWELWELLSPAARPTRAHASLWGVALIGAAGAGWAASAALALREYRLASAARAALRRLRTVPPGKTPDVWLAVIPDWYRFNRHLLESLASPLMERGEQVGILLLSSLRSGSRGENDLRSTGTELWSGLGFVADQTERCVIEQVVMPASPLDLGVAIFDAGCITIRSAARVAMVGPRLPVSHATAIDLEDRLMPLARLLSVDVMRGVLAAAATAQVVKRHDMAARRVVFCTANFPSAAAVDCVLRAAGAHTAEFMHGVGADDWHGAAESSTDIRFVWTKTDAIALAPTGARAIAAGIALRPSPPRRGRPNNVLMMTSYFHRDLLADRRHAMPLYQREILDLPALLRRAMPPATHLVFRWRPHPAELDELVQKEMATLECVELSRTSTLAEDLTWAHIIITVHSSTVVEALYRNVPVFVHVRPELEDTAHIEFISPERRFFRARDVVPRVVRCVESMARGDADVLAPEHAARIALAGTSEVPRSLFDAVDAWRAGSQLSSEM